MNLNQNVRVCADVLSQEVSGQTVLLNLKSETYYGLDEVGTRIWQLLKEQDDLSEIYNILLHEYDVSAEKLRSDIVNLIREMQENKLIEVVED